MKRRYLITWTVIMAVVLTIGLCGNVQAQEIEWTGARLGVGYSFTTGDILSTASYGIQLHEWKLEDVNLAVTFDAIGSVPKLVDIKDASLGFGPSIILKDTVRDFKIDIYFDVAKYGWCGAFFTKSF